MRSPENSRALAVPEEVADGQFELLAHVARTQQTGFTSFAMETNEGMARVSFRSHRGVVDAVGLRPPAPLLGRTYSHLTPEASIEGDELIYELDRVATQDAARSADNWFMGRLKAAPLILSPRGRRTGCSSSPEETDISSAARLLQEQDPERILFYTGAGMSCAGEAPMISYAELATQCDFRPLDIGPQNAETRTMNSAFVADFLRDAGLARRLLESYQVLLDNTYTDASTPAHEALADIFRGLGGMSPCLTTNYDLKHEAQGSGLQIRRVPTFWEMPDDVLRRKQNPYWGSHKYEACKTIKEAVVALSGYIRVVVVAGAAADRKGVLYRLTGMGVRNNCRILSINTEPASTLPYIGRNDLCIQGDCQEVLPALRAEMGFGD